MAFLFENVFMTMLGGIFIFFLWYMLLMIIPQTLSYKYIAAYMFCVCGYFLSFLTFISVNFFVPYVFIKENLSQDNLIEETLTSIILNIYYFFTSPIYFISIFIVSVVIALVFIQADKRDRKEKENKYDLGIGINE